MTQVRRPRHRRWRLAWQGGKVHVPGWFEKPKSGWLMGRNNPKLEQIVGIHWSTVGNVSKPWTILATTVDNCGDMIKACLQAKKRVDWTTTCGLYSHLTSKSRSLSYLYDIWLWVKTLVPSEPLKIAGIYGCSSHYSNGIFIGIDPSPYLTIPKFGSSALCRKLSEVSPRGRRMCCIHTCRQQVQ